MRGMDYYVANKNLTSLAAKRACQKYNTLNRYFEYSDDFSEASLLTETLMAYNHFLLTKIFPYHLTIRTVKGGACIRIKVQRQIIDWNDTYCILALLYEAQTKQ